MQASGPSIFHYNLTRPYPYKWITWAVLVGGVIIATLFSFAAVASNAYEFQSIYTTNPNATVDDHKWYQRAPFSWVTSMDATCQPALLTAGASYVTTNRVFTYTLDRMRTLGSNGQVFAAAGYRNSTLRDCRVAQIAVDLQRRDNTRVAGDEDFWSWGATTATAKATCNVFSESGPLQVNFTTQLLRTLDGGQMIDNFLSQNTSSNNANALYGLQIAMAFYQKLSMAMSYAAPTGPFAGPTDSWGAGTITLTRNPNVTDYTDARFFVADVGLSTDGSGLAFMHPPNTIQDWSKQWQSNRGFYLPNISITADAFGKSLYSVLLMDIGGNDTTNALLSQNGIEYLQSINDTDLAAASGKDIGIIGKVYDLKSGQVISNATTPATLFSQYLCSVPRQKNGLSIFVAVVLADIVFLNACWTVFGWGLNHWLGRRDPGMMQCEACAAARPLEAVRPKMIRDLHLSSEQNPHCETGEHGR